MDKQLIQICAISSICSPDLEQAIGRPSRLLGLIAAQKKERIICATSRWSLQSEMQSGWRPEKGACPIAGPLFRS